MGFFQLLKSECRLFFGAATFTQAEINTEQLLHIEFLFLANPCRSGYWYVKPDDFFTYGRVAIAKKLFFNKPNLVYELFTIVDYIETILKYWS